MAEDLGRVRSCSECRAQKLKCDAHEDYLRPCTRCRKKNLTCELSRKIKKTQRMTKTELLREIASLHDQLRSTNSSSQQTEIFAMPSAAQASQATPALSRPQSDSVCQSGLDGQISDTSSHNGHRSARSFELQRLPVEASSFQVAPTMLRLDQVDRRKINDCFALFFAHYETFVPGLFDSDAPPEQYYEQSPFLFWTIVTTGARRYADDPTLFQRVVPQVRQIALGSLWTYSNPILTIQAVLLLCLWPIPTDTMFRDSSHSLAGVAMQIALQNGLHIFGREQDYSRQNIDAGKSDVSLRFRLWIHCIMTFQNNNLVGGFPCWNISELNSFEFDLLPEHTLSPSLLYRYRLHKIQIDAIQAITQSTQLLKPDCGAPLNSLIEIFDAQVRALIPATHSAYDTLIQQCIRLVIKAFHFFAAPDTARTAGLVQVYALSCSVLNMLHDLDVAEDIALYSIQWLQRIAVLASNSILKITRSELQTHVDLEHGESAYFKAIMFVKRRSTENNDLDSRSVTILSQLWASDSLFRKKDGSLVGDRLRLRSRLFASVFFDTFWHWRATFGDWKVNPYTVDDDEVEPFAADERPAANWTLFSQSVGPSLRRDISTTPSARGISSFQAPTLDFDPFSDLPDWEFPVTEVPLGDRIDLTAMSHFDSVGID